MVATDAPAEDAAFHAEQQLATNGDVLATSRLHEKVIEQKEEQVRLL